MFCGQHGWRRGSSRDLLDSLSLLLLVSDAGFFSFFCDLKGLCSLGFPLPYSDKCLQFLSVHMERMVIRYEMHGTDVLSA